MVVLNGRFTGKKAVVVRVYDEGSKERKFGHVLIAGIERYPRKITKATVGKALERKSRVKPFVKFVNYSHIMPTRYNIESVLAEKLRDSLASDEALVADDSAGRSDGKKEALQNIKKIFQSRYKELGEPAKGSTVSTTTTGALYFFRKLKF